MYISMQFGHKYIYINVYSEKKWKWELDTYFKEGVFSLLDILLTLRNL